METNINLNLTRNARAKKQKNPSSKWPGGHKSNAESKHVYSSFIQNKVVDAKWLGLQRRQGYHAGFQRACVVVNVYASRYKPVNWKFCEQTAALRRFRGDD